LRFDDLVRVSLRQVIRHRRRYWGVVFAIAIGVAGFIAIITMGQDVKKNVNQDIVLIGGVTIIRCMFDPPPDTPPQWFYPDTVEAVKQLPGVQVVSQVGGKTVSGFWRGQQYRFPLVAVDENFWTLRSLWPRSGTLFGEKEIREHQRVLALGVRLAQSLFGNENPVGQTLEIDQEIYRIIGIIGGLRDIGLEKSAFLPLTTAMDRFGPEGRPSRLYVRCLTWDDVPQVAVLLPQRISRHQSVNHLLVEVNWDNLDQVKRVAWWIEFFVYLAFAATIVLGGLGIWNIMMAAVRSRTREIGLKKAMGAEDKDILAQFLTEALCLSLVSAILGVILGRILMELLSLWIGMRPSEELFLTCLALSLVFAALLGVTAGLYPSLQAARMEVVEATRYE